MCGVFRETAQYGKNAGCEGEATRYERHAQGQG